MRSPFVLSILVAMVYSMNVVCFAAEKQVIGDVVVYKERPSAYELAKTLFPPRTRAILLDSQHIAPEPTPTVALMITFQYDSVSVLPESKQYLDSLGEMLNLKQLNNEAIVINGHADASGDAYYNLKLSQARAEAIKSYLQRIHHIDPQRLVTLGHGEARLLDKRDPYSELNRRVEFTPVNANSHLPKPN